MMAAAVLVAGGAAATAVAMHLDVLPARAAAGIKGPLSVSPEVMERNILRKTTPVYPQQAKADHDTVNGTVGLGVTISKEGLPTNLHVVKSLREDYDQSAMTGVAQWQWKPFLLNGNPVPVETIVNVTYSLAK